MRGFRRVAALLVLTGMIGCGSPDGDGGFSALQRRGAQAMGVDQYSSAHLFEPLPDGGRIVLTRDPADSAGVAAIRSHMQLIAGRFAEGDFRIPGFVHDQAVPGTAVMAARPDRIRYAADTVPGGAQLRITTSDAQARAAVHEFLAFQRRDHRVSAHKAVSPVL